jgi:hypothetical protein
LLKSWIKQENGAALTAALRIGTPLRIQEQGGTITAVWVGNSSP